MVSLGAVPPSLLVTEQLRRTRMPAPVTISLHPSICEELRYGSTP